MGKAMADKIAYQMRTAVTQAMQHAQAQVQIHVKQAQVEDTPKQTIKSNVTES